MIHLLNQIPHLDLRINYFLPFNQVNFLIILIHKCVFFEFLIIKMKKFILISFFISIFQYLYIYFLIYIKCRNFYSIG